MASIEFFIVLVSLIAAGAGTLILLACMAGKRAQLVRSFNIQQKFQEHQAKIAHNRQQFKNKENTQSPTVAEVGAG